MTEYLVFQNLIIQARTPTPLKPSIPNIHSHICSTQVYKSNIAISPNNESSLHDSYSISNPNSNHGL